MIFKRKFKELTFKNVENFVLCQKLENYDPWTKSAPTPHPFPLGLDDPPAKNVFFLIFHMVNNYVNNILNMPLSLETL